MPKPAKYTIRKCIHDLHLWLGLASALVLFVVCLTGTIYTFKDEVERLIEPEKFYVNPPADAHYNLDDLKTYVEAETGSKVTRISVAHDTKQALQFSIASKEAGKRGTQLYVNPYTPAILGTGKGPASEFFGTVFKLHRWLLLDSNIGRPIVGWATVIFVLLSLSGFVLWFPKKVKGWKSIKPGFKIKFKGKWKRLNHDLHNTLGFYALFLILIMSFTGLCWSFEWYRGGLSSVLGTKVFDRSEGSWEIDKKSDGQVISLEEARSLGTSLLPYTARTTVYQLPKKENGILEVHKNPLERFQETAFDQVIVNAYTGALLEKTIFAELTLGQQLASQIKPLHLGTVYGLFSKVLYGIACLLATSLPVTGFIIWYHKLKKKKAK